MCELRLKANKSNLEDLLNRIKDLDLSQYTEESVAAFRAALADAKEQLELKNDTSASDKDDENKDDKDQGSVDKGNVDDQKTDNGDNKTNAPKTGDVAMPFGILMLMAAVCGSVMVFLRRKQSR